MIDKDDILVALKEVIDPDLNVSIVDQGMVKEITVENGVVTIILSTLYAGCSVTDYMRELIREKISALPEVDDVIVECRG